MRESDRIPLDGMIPAAKPAPRFVPTLTEMVDPGTVSRAVPPPGPSVEEVIDQVRRQVRPKLERRVEQVLYRLVGELIAKRWSTISADLSQEVDDLIAQAVREALAQQQSGKS